jgi:aspartyl-tRNA(Asn)/glutamyl-tRNA(Gln) amidotransferase subunit C
MHTSLRADTANSSLSKEDVLKNSPSSNGDYIKVPLTVKKESQ